MIYRSSNDKSGMRADNYGQEEHPKKEVFFISGLQQVSPPLPRATTLIS